MITFRKKKTGKSYYNQNNHGDLNLLYNQIEIELTFRIYNFMCTWLLLWKRKSIIHAIAKAKKVENSKNF